MPTFSGKRGRFGLRNGFSSVESACPKQKNGLSAPDWRHPNFGSALPDDGSAFFWSEGPFPRKKACISPCHVALRSSESRFFGGKSCFLPKMVASELQIGVFWPSQTVFKGRCGALVLT